MRRFTLAMTLGLGLAFTGCGPTADPVDADKPVVANPAPEAAPKDLVGGGAPKKGGGGGAAPGIPDNVMKGMQSDAYRNMPGSQGPGGPAKDKDKGKDAAKPADDKKDAAPAKAAEGDKKDTVTLTDDEIKNIKMLPDAEDQKLALAQKICAVGESDGKPNHLGEMGVPVKEVVKGKTVFLCCKSCVEDLKKDPDKYLAKIAK